MNDRVKVGLGLTLLLPPAQRGGLSESVRIELSGEADLAQGEDQPAARMRLYGQLVSEVEAIVQGVRQHRRLPSQEEIRVHAAGIPRDPEANMPGSYARRPAPPAEEDDWQGSHCDACGAALVWARQEGKDVALDGTTADLTAFVRDCERDTAGRPVWRGGVPPRKHACPEARAGHCKSCGTAIYWLRTREGKRMPTEIRAQDGRVVRPGEVFDPAIHVSHFATCPQADQHRQRQQQQEQHPAGAADLKVIEPWLPRIAAAEETRSLDLLTAVRSELWQTRHERTPAQNELLRQATGRAKAAIERAKQEERRRLEEMLNAPAPQQPWIDRSERDPEPQEEPSQEEPPAPAAAEQPEGTLSISPLEDLELEIPDDLPRAEVHDR